ncbi:helix-turn-helix domain-containing protein [Kibdelosporangium aridum]|nr:helix-turn-helix transcriptional regulator [Kibdelosporangium aridum]
MEQTEDLSPGSLVRRWRLGKRLRKTRIEAGKTMAEAAAYIGVRRPTISRIETGRQAILAKNVKYLCQLYGVGAPEVDMLMRQAEESNERGWWASYSDTMPDWFETYVGFEADAKEIWLYCAELVPGILQTSSYQRALQAGFGREIDEKGLAFRLERQQRLETRKPRLRIVLNEAVFRRGVGDMGEQGELLAKVSKRMNVTLQVLTFDSGPHAAMKGPFNMLTLPGEPAPNFVYLEHKDGAVYLERPVDLGKYSKVFESLTKQALSADESRDFLATLA